MNVKLKIIERGIKQQNFVKVLGVPKATFIRIESDIFDIRISLMKEISDI